MLSVPKTYRDPRGNDVVSAVLLDFILGEAHPSGWELTPRADFVAPTRDFLRRVNSGRLAFNDVEYQLRWLNQGESDRVIEDFDLRTWQ